MPDFTPGFITGPTEAVDNSWTEDLHLLAAGPIPNSDPIGDVNFEVQVPDVLVTAQAVENRPEDQLIRSHPTYSQRETFFTYRCGACALRFDRWEDQRDHFDSTGHLEYYCKIRHCDYAGNDYNQFRDHTRSKHPEFRVCNQCKKEFGSIHDLGWHASQTSHASFFCQEEDCARTYSRFDVFRRHQETHRFDAPRYPCPHCRKYRGADGFKRKDHLTQHMRNYHHIGVDELSRDNTRQRSCPHEDCSDWRREDIHENLHAFQKSSDYISHMRKVHKESDFPCTERDCNRTGPKGYFRMRDLQKHKLKEHGIPIE